jgi:hypothetical protein
MRTARTAGLALLLTLFVEACGPTTPSGAASVAPIVQPTGPGSASASVNLPDFEGRVRDATAREGALIRAVAGESAGGPAELRLAAGQLQAWVRAERDWLTAHPPDGCYQDAAGAFTTAVDGIQTAAELLDGLAATSPRPSDDTTGQQAAEQLSAATAALAHAADLAKAARTACR